MYSVISSKFKTLAVAMLFLALGFKQVHATTISVSGPNGSSTFSTPSGSSFEVAVSLDSYADLYAWQFDFGWNPSVLSFTGMTEGPALQSQGSTFFLAGLIDSTAGTASGTASTLLAAISGATGTNGTLAYLDFQAVADGVSSLTLSNIILLDSNLNNIPLATGSGSVTVGSATAVTPEPSSFYLLGTGLILLFSIGGYRTTNLIRHGR